MPFKEKMLVAVDLIRRRKLPGFLKVVTNYYFYNKFTRRHLSPRCFSFPIHLQVEISKLCNLRCKMCEYSYKKEPKALMSFTQFKAVLSSFPHLHSLDLTGIGEPFCNPEFIKMLRFAKGQGLKVEFSTNGLLLDETRIDELVALEIDKISFSVDAATKETHEAIRQGSSFDQLTDNIRRLSEIGTSSRLKRPQLHLSYILMNENLVEAEEAVPLAKKLGIQTICFRDLFVFEGGAFTQENQADRFDKDFRYQLGKRILKQAESSGITVHLSISLSESNENRKIFCYRPWRSGYVDVFGNLYPCCRLTQKNSDIASISFGNLFSQYFSKIWNGADYQTLRKGFLHPTAIPSLCRDCDCLRK